MNAIAPTLSTRHFPAVKPVVRDVLLIVFGSLFVALFAQLQIPIQPVPVTGQTFAVLLVGAALGSKRGAASLSLYLVEGLAGLPFFAGGAHGWDIVFGPTPYTGGYLFGFIVAAYVIGLLVERGLDRSFRTSLIVFFVGEVILFTIGVIWLGFIVGPEGALTGGLYKFIPGEIAKMIAAGLALPIAWKFVK